MNSKSRKAIIIGGSKGLGREVSIGLKKQKLRRSHALEKILIHLTFPPLKTLQKSTKKLIYWF